MALAKDEISYRGSVGDVSSSMSISGPSTSWGDIGVGLILLLLIEDVMCCLR